MVHAISFCLYGPSNPKYYEGLLKNIEIAEQYFKENWVVYVYAGSDVPERFLDKIRSNKQVRIRYTGITGSRNMIRRFYAIDEPDVEVAFFRDADSRLHWKDRWAIRDFLQRDKKVHIIRDHVDHCVEIPGGLWGMRKGALDVTMQTLDESWVAVHVGSGHPNDISGHGIDQNFLTTSIYYRICGETLIHYSFDNCINKHDSTVVQFPFKWSNEIYCGKIELLDYEANPIRKVLPFFRHTR